MLTASQQGIFQPLRKSAWLAYCERNPLMAVNNKGAQDSWYRKILVANLGMHTTKEIRTDKEFDLLCLAFASEAGDLQAIDYWSNATERRALWRLRQTMKNAGVNEAYVKGIQRNMRMPDKSIEDLPAELILKLNTAVFVYMKRKEGKAKAEAEAVAETEVLQPTQGWEEELSFQ